MFMRLIISALTCIAIAGCGPATLKKAEEKDGPALGARAIYDLVAGNSMQLTAYDFNARIFFDKDGRMSALDEEGQRDFGSWDISAENRLCLKFRLWYYGDLKCYSIVPGAGSEITFFTTNGASYYSGTIKQGDPANLAAKMPTKKSKRFLRTEFATEQSGAAGTAAPAGTASAPAEQTVKQPEASSLDNEDPGAVRRLARNCPGCNLAGADLKELDLVKANLEGADLSRADLRYANLRRANLAGADLSAARLNHANLPGADLRKCNLRNADLQGANLLMADLTGADLTGANLTNAYLENTKGIK